MMQKVNYIHQNPVRAGLEEKAEDYRFSNARLWRGNSLEDEPLITDHKQIDWRRAAWPRRLGGDYRKSRAFPHIDGRSPEESRGMMWVFS